jgi:hypothetical protein
LKLLRERIVKPLYIATPAIAMVGWMLALYHGLEWALGAQFGPSKSRQEEPPQRRPFHFEDPFVHAPSKTLRIKRYHMDLGTAPHFVAAGLSRLPGV